MEEWASGPSATLFCGFAKNCERFANDYEKEPPRCIRGELRYRPQPMVRGVDITSPASSSLYSDGDNSPSSTSQEHKGAPTSAIIGGAFSGVTVIVVTLLLLLRRRRRRNNNEYYPNQGPSSHNDIKRFNVPPHASVSFQQFPANG